MNAESIRGRRKTFAEKVAEGHSATEAYLLAGYHAAKRETAHRAASRLYTNPGIRAYIRELRRTQKRGLSTIIDRLVVGNGQYTS